MLAVSPSTEPNSIEPPGEGKSIVKSASMLPDTKSAIDQAIALDHHLSYFRPVLEARYAYFRKVLNDIIASEGSLDAFTQGYRQRGINVTAEGIVYREWAPGATAAYFMGDFSMDAHF